MRTFLSLTMLCALSLLLSQCSQLEYEELPSYAESPKETNFSPEMKKYGEELSRTINATVKQINKQKINYSNIKDFNSFSKQYSKDFPIEGGSTKSSHEVYSSFADPDIFINDLKSLTKIQLEVLIKIDNAHKISKSLDDFLNKLLEINEFIYSNVPEIEQERLLSATAMLYYGFETIYSLADEGLISSQQSAISQLRIKTRSIEETAELTTSDPSTWCASGIGVVFLASASGGSITTGGVVLTAAGTVVCAKALLAAGCCYLLYKFIVKCTETVDCLAKYIRCTDVGPHGNYQDFWKCDGIYKYCLSQGVWDTSRF